MAKISKRDWKEKKSKKKGKVVRPDDDWMGFDVRQALDELKMHELEEECLVQEELLTEFTLEELGK